MDGLICYKNEKRFLKLDLLKQYRKSLEELITAFNAMRYATCEALMNHLSVLAEQLTDVTIQPTSDQKQSVLWAEHLRIQELQMLFYQRSQELLNDLLKQIPKRAHLDRLGKSL